MLTQTQNGKTLNNFIGYQCLEDDDYTVLFRGYYELSDLSKKTGRSPWEYPRLYDTANNLTRNSNLFAKAKTECNRVIIQRNSYSETKIYMDYRYLQLLMVKNNDNETILASLDVLDLVNISRDLSLDMQFCMDGDPKLILHLFSWIIKFFRGDLSQEVRNTISETIARGLPQELSLYTTIIDDKVIFQPMKRS
jgi:hypothetical protein